VIDDEKIRDVMESEDLANPKLRRLRLRYDGTCIHCGVALSRGADAWYDAGLRKVLCLACGPAPSGLQKDDAGVSAAAEGSRRRKKRVDQVRRQHGDYAAAVAEQLATTELSGTWGKGSDGESRLAAFVAAEVGDAVIPLHDRLIPGTRGNIDHIWVARSGVWVVDAKAYKGKVTQREVGPIWRRDSEVYVGGRNRTHLAKGVVRQVEAVLVALRLDPDFASVAVFGALCFLESEWGLLDFPFQVGYVWVLFPGALRKRLKKSGPLSREDMSRIATRLDLSLPRAASPH
jgi:hypothetical protein